MSKGLVIPPSIAISNTDPEAGKNGEMGAWAVPGSPFPSLENSTPTLL